MPIAENIKQVFVYFKSYRLWALIIRVIYGNNYRIEKKVYKQKNNMLHGLDHDILFVMEPYPRPKLQKVRINLVFKNASSIFMGGGEVNFVKFIIDVANKSDSDLRLISLDGVGELEINLSECIKSLHLSIKNNISIFICEPFVPMAIDVAKNDLFVACNDGINYQLSKLIREMNLMKINLMSNAYKHVREELNCKLRKLA